MHFLVGDHYLFLDFLLCEKCRSNDNNYCRFPIHAAVLDWVKWLLYGSQFYFVTGRTCLALVWLGPKNRYNEWLYLFQIEMIISVGIKVFL